MPLQIKLGYFNFRGIQTDASEVIMIHDIHPH